ncbi:asparaginase [Castellaniella sp. WN]
MSCGSNCRTRGADEEIRNGADGIVLIQGTDTLEESAFFLDLLWDKPQPLIMTGAMRCASEIGPDGFRNLRDALFLAANPEAECRGVLVVLNEEIHEGRWVRKGRSTGPGAFQSANAGPCGSIRGPHVRFWRSAPERLAIPVPGKFEKRVGILHASMDGGPDLIESMTAYRYDGLVIAGFGTGHVPSGWHPAIEAAAARIPIVIASRVTESFSYPDEGWLPILAAKKGDILFSGFLDALKSRILLLLLIETDRLHP